MYGGYVVIMTEFAREGKFIRYCVNQNAALNLLSLKASIKSTPLTLQTATPRVHFASSER